MIIDHLLILFILVYGMKTYIVHCDFH